MTVNSDIKKLNEPRYYWAGTGATYEKEPEEFLKANGYEDVKVLEKGEELGWSYILLKKGDEYTVAFRGVRYWHIEDWAIGFFRMLTDNKRSIRSIEKTIEAWEQKHQMKVTVLTGHSHGGWHATHVFKNRDGIWHITWNGHKNERGPNNINLCTMQDPLSTVKILGGIKGRGIILGEGTHSHQDFEPLIETSDNFQDLFQRVKHLNPSSQILTKLSCQGQSIDELNQRLLDENILDSHEALMGKMKDVSTSCQQLMDDLEKHEKGMAFAKTMEYLEFAGIEALQHLEGMRQDKGRNTRMKNLEKGHLKAKENLERVEKKQEFQSTLTETKGLLALQYSPAGIRQSISDMIRYSREFEENVGKLSESIQNANQTKERIDFAKIDLNSLDLEQKKYYQKALKEAQKMSKGLRIVGTALRTIEAALSPFAKAHPYLMAAVSVAKVGNGLLEQSTGKKCDKIENKFRRAREKSIQTHEKLNDAVMQNISQREHLHMERQTQLGLLLQHPEIFDPAVHIEGLKICINEFESTQRVIAGSLDRKKTALNGLNSEIEKYREKASSGKHKKNRQDAKQKLLDREAKAFLLQQEIDALSMQSETNQSIIQKTKKELDQSEYTRSIREIGWSHLNSEQSENSSIDPNQPLNTRRELLNRLNRDIQDAHDKYQQVHRADYEARAGMLNAAENLGKAFAQATGIQGFDKLANLGTQINQLHYLTKYFRTHALPLLSELKKGFTDKGYRGVLNITSLSNIAITFAIPGANWLTATLTIVSILKEWKYPIEPLVEKALRNIKDKLDEFHQSWESGLAVIKKENGHLAKDIESIQISLNRVHQMLFSKIEDVNEQIRSRSWEAEYARFMTDIQKKCEDLQIISGVAIEGVRSDNVMNLKFSGYLERLMIELKMSAEGVNNGYYLGNNEGMDGDHKVAFPIVDISLVRRNPESLTGYLSQKLNPDIQMPNWKLLEILTENFLKMVKTLQDENLLNDRLNKKENVRQNMVAICTTILDYQERLSLLAGNIKSTIQVLFKDQLSIWARMITDAHLVQKGKEFILDQREQAAIDHFETAKRQQMVQQEFVGHSKYFAYTEFVQESFESKIGGVDFNKITDDSWYGSESYAQKYRVFEFVTLRAASIGVSCILNPFLGAGVICYNLWSLDQRLLKNRNGIVSLTHSLDHFEFPARLSKKQKKMEVIFKRSIQGLLISREQKISFVESSDSRSLLSKCIGRSYRLIVDLKNRRIKDLSEVSADERNEKEQYVFMEVNLLTGNKIKTNAQIMHIQPAIEIAPLNNGFIPPGAVRRIPVPGHTFMDAMAYNQAVTTLMNNYFAFLDHRKDCSVKLENNPFAALVGKCSILQSKNGESIPLAFPTKLIKELEKMLNPELRYLEASGEGTLYAECYDFSPKDGKIVIQFNYISARDLYKANPDNKLYCVITVAELDSLTIQAFSEPGIEGNVRCSSNELLLQAMYGSFGNLGLPGQESFRVNSQIVAPKEIPFIGMYLLWDRMPDVMINFNSGKFSAKHSTNLSNFVHRKEYQKGLLSHQLSTFDLPQVCRDYIEVASITNQQKMGILRNEENYRHNFHLLLSLIKLFSGIDNRTLFHELKDQLGLLPPEMQDNLFNEWFDKGSIPEVTEEKIDGFICKVLENTSEEVELLLKHREKIQDLKTSLESN